MSHLHLSPFVLLILPPFMSWFENSFHLMCFHFPPRPPSCLFTIWICGPAPSPFLIYAAKPGKGLTSCTTTCSLTAVLPPPVSLATTHALTNPRTRITTVSGRRTATGPRRFLVRWARLLMSRSSVLPVSVCVFDSLVQERPGSRLCKIRI